MKTRTIITYVLAATIVLILGAFSGWYFFLKSQSQTTAGEDAARGFTTGPTAQIGTSGQSPTTGELERAGFFSRLLSSVTGGGTGVSESLTTSLTSDIGGIPNAATIQTSTSSATAAPRPAQMLHVHTKPVAGMSFIQSGKSELLRYVERSSGYIFDADPETGLVTRLTNTLVPKVYEALFTHNGKIIERSLDDAGNIVTVIGSVGTSSKSGEATSSMMFSSIALPQNIEAITFDPKTGALFYFLEEGSGIVGIRAEANGAKPTRVFTSSIRHWRHQWLTDGRIILTQAASDDVPGYSYELKGDGSLSPLVRSTPGLTMLGRNAGTFLYGQSSGGALALFVQVQGSAAPIGLQIRTIADKCVWVPDLSAQGVGTNRNPVGTSGKSAQGRSASGGDLIAYCAVPRGSTARRFLDEWYQGSAHSSDVLWRVNASAGSAQIVYAPNTSIDMENLTISSAGTHIAFMNAIDKSLWLLRLTK